MATDSDWEQFIKQRQDYCDTHEFLWDQDAVVDSYQISKLSDIAKQYPDLQACVSGVMEWDDLKNQSAAFYPGNVETESADFTIPAEDGLVGNVIAGNAKFQRGLLNLELDRGMLIVLGDVSTSVVVASGSDIIVNGVIEAKKGIVHRYSSGVFSSKYTKTPLWVNFDGYMDHGFGFRIDHRLTEADDDDRDFRSIVEPDALICANCTDCVEISGYKDISELVAHPDYGQWLKSRSPCEECEEISGVWDVSDEYWIARLMNDLPIVTGPQ